MTNSEKILIFRTLLVMLVICNYLVKQSITESVIDQKRAIIQRYLDRAATEAQCSVNEYQKSKSQKKYFRLSWREGKKTKHLHIPGGNVNAILAQYRARKLRELIARGAKLEEVIAAVQTYAQTGV